MLSYVREERKLEKASQLEEWGPPNRQGLMVGVKYHIKYRINRNTNASRKDEEKCRRVKALNANPPQIGDQSAPLLPEEAYLHNCKSGIYGKGCA